MIDRNDDLSDSDADNDDVGTVQSSLGVRETLLIEDHNLVAPVSLFYLLALTCGVGGYALNHIRTVDLPSLTLDVACKLSGLSFYPMAR